MKRKSNYLLPWFLLGLGANFQVLYSMSLTEIFVFIAAPFYYLKDRKMMGRDGFGMLFLCSVMVFLGCCLACVVNHSPQFAVLRGLATTGLLMCAIVVWHRFLLKNADGVKWYIVGYAISMIACTFFLKRFSEAGVSAEGGFGAATTEEIVSGAIYWTTRVKAILDIPLQGWYLSLPTWLSASMAILFAFFSIMVSASGRSMALVALAGVGLIIIGGRKRARMRLISQYFIVLLIGGIIFVKGAHMAYRFAAENGLLNETAQRKYELQTRGGRGVLNLLMGGRSSSFVGMLAAIDHPIVGLGPWAIDTQGYMEEFLAEFGSEEDWADVVRSNLVRQRLNIGDGLVACHAVWLEMWVWYGIFGLIFCLYIMYVFLRYLIKDISVIPHWYGYLAVSMPSLFWMMLFSPLTDRIGLMLVVCCCLYARAVKKGVCRLPDSMIKTMIEKKC